MIHQCGYDLVCPYFLHCLSDVGTKEKLWIVGGQMVIHDTFTIRLGDGTGETMKERSEATYFVRGTYGFEVELCQRLNNITGTL